MTVKGQLAQHGIHGLAAGGEFCPWTRAVFKRPQELSVGELSQQLPLRFLDERIPQSFMARWNSSLQY